MKPTSPTLRAATVRAAPMPRTKPLRRLARWIAACAERRRGRLVLRQADEALLSDIGISRADAWAESRKPCWRR